MANLLSHGVLIPVLNKREFREGLEELWNLSDHLSNMADTGFDIEGNIMRPLYQTFEHIIRLMEVVYKDTVDKWIEYFVYECQFGESPGEIKVTTDNIEIVYTLDSIDSFIDYFEKEVCEAV